MSVSATDGSQNRGIPAKNAVGAGIFSRSLLLVLMVQIPLLIIFGIRNINRINPDGVSYLRIAEYYSNARFDLAISGYWGPLLSWLIMLPLHFGETSPLAAARLATGFSAIVFLVGAVRLFTVILVDPVEVMAASLLVVFFSAVWSVATISPDLLVNGLMLLAVSEFAGIASFQAGTASSKDAWASFRAGIFFGFAYLAKSVALPMATGLVFSFLAFSILAKATTYRATIRHAVLALFGLAIVAGPWISILSTHYSAFTVTTSASINHALVGPGEKIHPFIRTYVAPEPGRVTTWEDPDPKAYNTWSPFDSRQAFEHQILVIAKGIQTVTRALSGLDFFGIGLVSAIFGLCIHSAWSRTLSEERWRLCGVAVLVMAGVYVPVSSAAEEVRYYLACYALLLGVSIGFVGNLILRTVAPDSAGFRRKIRLLHLGGIALVISSFAVPVLADLKRAIQGRESANLALAREVVASLMPAGSGAFASVGKEEGDAGYTALYAAYLMKTQFYGNRSSPSVDDVLLTGAKFLVVEGSSAVNAALRMDSRVAAVDIIGQYKTSSANIPVQLYRVVASEPRK